MCSVWVIDFVANEKSVIREGISQKKAKRICRKRQKRDPYSLFIVVPFGFSL